MIVWLNGLLRWLGVVVLSYECGYEMKVRKVIIVIIIFYF